jgi:N-glycosylase/DNA lyase
MTGAAHLRDSGPTVVLAPRGHPERAFAWGHSWQVGTAAYWVAVTEAAAIDGTLRRGPHRHRLGRNLAEEVAACLLGGHGMPYETGLAAYHAVRDAGLLTRCPDDHELERELRKPLDIGGRAVHYRFPAQRARRLAAALHRLRTQAPPTKSHELRDWLMLVPGIGPKTAGWIVRNHLGSDDVAIIDVHVRRAGVAASVFDRAWTPTSDYQRLEAFFLAWAAHGGVRAGDLDAIIWSEQAHTARISDRRAHGVTSSRLPDAGTEWL